jgi:hypothetical protein
MIRAIRSLLSAPSPEMLAQRELEQARRQLLEAESAAEYAEAMSVYHRTRIERLTNMLHGKLEGGAT